MNRHMTTASELKERLEAERIARALLVYRDGEGHQRILALQPEIQKVTVGRGPAADLRLAWDREVSRAHAELEQVGGAWTVSDDGLSTNGTYRNDERVRGRIRLKDGDQLRFGKTLVAFREPVITEGDTTVLPDESPSLPITQTQHSVLVALCRPLREEPYGPPATNKAIAQELTLSVDAVKTHLRRIADVLEIGDLPQNEKRAKLAWTALTTGLVTPRDLFG
jgi:pSer/pThr/pTyr-binding forkhead associated (FHA) protein